MSKGFEFIVVKNPVIKRNVEISLGGRQGKKLEMIWNRLDMEAAADALEDYSHRTAFYVDKDSGESLSLTEAAKDFLKLGDTDGSSVPVPLLHDYVEARTAKERLLAQRNFLRQYICGSIEEDNSGAESLLAEWNLTSEGEVMDFTDHAVFDSVFGTNEFFFPVLSDLLTMLNELVSGVDKVKNSKTSGGSSRTNRRGAMQA